MKRYTSNNIHTIHILHTHPETSTSAHAHAHSYTKGIWHWGSAPYILGATEPWAERETSGAPDEGNRCTQLYPGMNHSTSPPYRTVPPCEYSGGQGWRQLAQRCCKYKVSYLSGFSDTYKSPDREGWDTVYTQGEAIKQYRKKINISCQFTCLFFPFLKLDLLTVFHQYILCIYYIYLYSSTMPPT